MSFRDNTDFKIVYLHFKHFWIIAKCLLEESCRYTLKINNDTLAKKNNNNNNKQEKGYKWKLGDYISVVGTIENVSKNIKSNLQTQPFV